jgi:ribonuclease R
MHGDTVVARRLRSGGRPSAPAAAGTRRRSRGREARPAEAGDTDEVPAGRIVRVLRRANTTIIGTYQRAGREEWVVPDDWRLGPLSEVRGASLGAASGEKVVLAVSLYPGPGRPFPAGAVVERLGPAGEPDVETLAIIRSLGLRDSFPREVMAEAEGLPREVTAGEREGRLDLTAETVFTIDDAEARDLDDAISISSLGAGPDLSTAYGQPGSTHNAGGDATPRWRLGVHIADVSHYVAAGTALDREAEERGTSVYLVDRVLPMFPPRLSNGIASLHPEVERLTVSVFMDIDRRGRVTGHEVARSVIRSVARLTYDAVAAFLGPEFGEILGEGPVGKGHIASGTGNNGITPPVGAALREMARPATLLRRRRLERGSLDFDLPEEKMKLDGEGRPVELVVRPRNVATQLIEEFMIAANETVADYLRWSGVPFIARIHEEPFPDDLEALRETLAPLGYRVPTNRVPRPAELQAVLEAARGRPESAEVHSALLRALPLARYSAVHQPHYALASPNYLHFTSPIRRYPDLSVHRQALALLDGRAHLDHTDTLSLQDRLGRVAEAGSRAERLAERAERDSLKLKKTELALRYLGWEDEGVVIDVFAFGAFIRLPNGIEGLVPAEAPGAAGLRLGQRRRVQVVRADLERRRVDLALTDVRA